MNKLALFFVCTSIMLYSINSLSCQEEKYDDPNFQTLINEIDKMLLSLNANGVPQISKAVRQIFHDCVSGCNGCIDLNFPNNTGLGQIYGKSNIIYRKFVLNRFPPHKTFYGVPMSYADLLALIGCRAVHKACPECNKIDFKFCRIDAATTENKEIFPTATKSWKDQEIFFKENFKTFDIPQDIVAIFGAHNLGNACPDNSGFNSWWVSQGNAILDNQFYKNLISKEYDLNYKNSLNDRGKCQWYSKVGSDISKHSMMLNSDMSLLLDFQSDDITGCNPTCSYNSTTSSTKCPRNMLSSDLVEVYANDVIRFRKDFITAFNKMIENGYKPGQLIDPLITKTCPSNSSASNEILKLILINAEKSSKKEQFKIYHFLFNKKYSLNSDEAISRYQIFKTNLIHIKEQNEKSNHTKYGINRFFDQTVEEYLGKDNLENSMYLEFKLNDEIDKYIHLDLDAAK